MKLLSLSLSLIVSEAAQAGEIVSAVTITTYPDGTETVEETSSQGFDYEAHLSDWRYDSEHAGSYTWVGSVSGRADGSQVSTSTWSVPELSFPTDAELATMLSMKQGQTITEAGIVAMREAAESSTTLDAPVVSESLEDWLAEPEDDSTWEVSVFLGVSISAGPRYADREQRIEEIEDVVYELADDLQLDAEVQPFMSVIGFKAWLTRNEVEDLLAVPEGVDHITAVAWWMDRRHEDGHTVNDIDIEVQRRDGSLWVTEGESVSLTDDKERIHVEGDPSDFGGVRWRVNIIGEDVRGTDPVCGAGRQREYLAVKLEGS